ncbi:hypothetical protein AB0C76_35415 [Kitasatospora sp. NPDC048722]
MSAADLAVDTGRCLVDLGEPGPAHHALLWARPQQGEAGGQDTPQ